MRTITLEVPVSEELAELWEALPAEKRNRYAVAASGPVSDTLSAVLSGGTDEEEDLPLTSEEIAERERKLAVWREYGSSITGTTNPIPLSTLRREVLYGKDGE
jgi:hypothetical protein